MSKRSETSLVVTIATVLLLSGRMEAGGLVSRVFLGRLQLGAHSCLLELYISPAVLKLALDSDFFFFPVFSFFLFEGSLNGGSW